MAAPTANRGVSRHRSGEADAATAESYASATTVASVRMVSTASATTGSAK